MRELRPPPEPERTEEPAARWADDDAGTEKPYSRPAPSDVAVEPLRLPVPTRRHHPWLLVEVDSSPATHRALAWALREAARREATVLAVAVVGDGPGTGPDHGTALELLEVRVAGAVAETGVHGRARTAVLDRPVYDALRAAACGSDLVIVGAHGKTVLRPAVARPPFRRLPRGA